MFLYVRDTFLRGYQTIDFYISSAGLFSSKLRNVIVLVFMLRVQPKRKDHPLVAKDDSITQPTPYNGKLLSVLCVENATMLVYERQFQQLLVKHIAFLIILNYKMALVSPQRAQSLHKGCSLVMRNESQKSVLYLRNSSTSVP